MLMLQNFDASNPNLKELNALIYKVVVDVTYTIGKLMNCSLLQIFMSHKLNHFTTKYSCFSTGVSIGSSDFTKFRWF